MALSYNSTIRTAMMDAITTNADAEAGACYLRIYDGTKPTPISGGATNVLAELRFTDPIEPGAIAGVWTASSITAESTAPYAGTNTATWFRVFKGNGTTVVMDGTVGTSGADLILDSTSITAGQTVSVTSFVITEGNA